jgi:tetratricopeptide (TPR) repeat protein
MKLPDFKIETLADLISVALERHRNNDVFVAIGLYRIGLCFDPGHSDLWNLSGAAFEQAGARDRAASCLYRALKSQYDLVAAAVNLANLLRKQGDSAAMFWYRRAVVLNPCHPGACLGLGDAAAAFALRLDPSAVPAWRGRGRRLIETGDGATAARALERAAALEPADAETWHLLMTARRKCGDGAGALTASRRAADLAPQSPEACFNLAELLTEAMRPDEAEPLHARASVLRPGWHAAFKRLYARLQATGRIDDAIALARRCLPHMADRREEVLAEIALAYGWAGRWGDALAALRESAQEAPGVAALLGPHHLRGASPPDATAAIRRASEHARPRTDPPVLAERFRRAWKDGDWRGARIVLLTPEYINCNPAYIKHDLTHSFLAAAAATGIECLHIPADAVSYPMFMTPEKRRAASAVLADIAERVAAFRPDIVVVDGNATGDADTINIAWLAQLRRRTPFDVVAFIPDNYGDMERLRYWLEIARLLVHFEPSSERIPGVAAEKSALCFVPPAPEFQPGEAGAARDIACFFAGSATSGALGYRTLWLAAAMSGVEGCRFSFSDRTAARAIDLAAYADLHRRAKIALNVGYRPNGRVIVTGRTYEAIHSGCLLFEQAQSRLSDFFIPWRHFVPFADADDLVGKLRYFTQDDGLRDEIARQGAAFAEEHYNAKYFWPYVLQQVKAASR